MLFLNFLSTIFTIFFAAFLFIPWNHRSVTSTQYDNTLIISIYAHINKLKPTDSLLQLCISNYYFASWKTSHIVDEFLPLVERFYESFCLFFPLKTILTCLLEDLTEQLCWGRGHLTGLGHNRVPTHNSWRHFEAKKVEGEIPGTNQSCHTYWTLDRVAGSTGPSLNSWSECWNNEIILWPTFQKYSPSKKLVLNYTRSYLLRSVLLNSKI